MDADVRQKNRELSQKKKKLIELQKRIGELDTIFQRIYEDNITGKLSDERFMKMSKGYEDEQHTLQAEADKIQNELQQEEKKSVDVKRFLAIVKKYTDLTELTPEILWFLTKQVPFKRERSIESSNCSVCQHSKKCRKGVFKNKKRICRRHY